MTPLNTTPPRKLALCFDDAAMENVMDTILYCPISQRVGICYNDDGAIVRVVSLRGEKEGGK